MFRAAAAIHVLTSEEIRRSGATSIPEALRLVPGVQVARLGSSTWAISARGFNGPFANKLLVLLDGRTLYTPLFSGVFWDVQDTLLEDIDRIEVILGPGGTLWGANAVNGIINIITKPARATQGGLVGAGGGTEERGFGEFRYGGKWGEGLHYRVYGKYLDRDSSSLASGADAGDEWSKGQGGFRVDWTGAGDTLRLSGDAYEEDADQILTAFSLSPPFAFSVNDTVENEGGNLLGRWTHGFEGGSELAVQFYYDAARRDSLLVGKDWDTLDFELQHRFRPAGAHELVWGGGYRYFNFDLRNGINVGFTRSTEEQQVFNLFVQDEITLLPERLWLTLGTKVEHNDFTGIEVQPNARLGWAPADSHFLWAAVSRAVRTPSVAENYLSATQIVPPPLAALPGTPPIPLPIEATLRGAEDFGSEELIAFEAGYRAQPVPRLTLDTAAFYNLYDDLGSEEAAAPDFLAAPVPHLLFGDTFGNGLFGETYGVELNATWQALPNWRWHAGYSYLQMQLHTRASSTDAFSETLEGQSPDHQVVLRSAIDLSHRVQFDATLRYVDELPAIGIPSYVELDLRLGFKPLKGLELALVGQNLLHDRHTEFPTAAAQGVLPVATAEIERGFYGLVRWRF